MDNAMIFMKQQAAQLTDTAAFVRDLALADREIRSQRKTAETMAVTASLTQIAQQCTEVVTEMQAEERGPDWGTGNRDLQVAQDTKT